MPVDFLTRTQELSYGRYNAEPSEEQLAKYFFLDDIDLNLINSHRGQHNRLGFALQLTTLRFLSTFLPNPIDVPLQVVRHVALQIGVTNTDCLPQYLSRETTHREHAEKIQKFYNYQDFTDQPEHLRLVRWLYTRAWLTAERPSILFDLATARLVNNKVILPGVSVLARLVASVKDRAANRLWRMLYILPNTKQRSNLQDLLMQSSTNTRQTNLDKLRKPPTRIGAISLVEALERLKEVRDIRISDISLAHIPAARLKVLARYANTAPAKAIARMPNERRIATLLAFANLLQSTAHDDVIDILDQFITKSLTRAKNKGQEQRLRTLKDLDSAALKMGNACTFLLDPSYPDEQIRNIVFKNISRESLMEAVVIVEQLTRPPNDKYYEQLLGNYKQVRHFLPKLLDIISFSSTKAGQGIITAWDFLKSVEKIKKPSMQKAPLQIVNKLWHRYVIGKDKKVDHRFYTFCTLVRLQDSLKRRDIFITPSERWASPHSKLLQGVEWEKQRVQVCRTLGHSTNSESVLTSLSLKLEQAYQRTASNLPKNSAISIERTNAKDHLILSKLDKLDEPESLKLLRQQVHELLPNTDLPEAILEIQAQTGFANEFTHISEGNARVEDLELSICAVLIAVACNTGLTPLIREDIPALTRNRLSWVQQNYIRAETITKANAVLVDEQSRIPLAQVWGGGEVASADGLRFVVPVRTLHAGHNSKYFGNGRGVTYYNFTSDQFTGFHGIVIPGTLRDSLFLLDGLLEQQTALRPTEVMTDTAGYSDVVFGLFYLLGYQFSPRIADIGDARFWRINLEQNYGALTALARNKINTALINQNWDDLLRIAGSLKLGKLSASELIRTFQAGRKASTLTKALTELGRIIKTLFLLSYIDDEAYRRRILVQLNRGELRHSLARVVFHGNRGELRQPYREGQEDQLGALGLVLNILVLWNTRYMNLAIEHLRTKEFPILQQDLVRLSPLIHSHINLLGRYSFNLPESIKKGELRPLRTL
jgi:TnpA family transposase